MWMFGGSKRKSSPQPQSKAGDGKAVSVEQEAVKAQAEPATASQAQQQTPPQPQEAAMAALEAAQKKAQEKPNESQAPKPEQKAAEGDLLSVFAAEEAQADPNAQKLVAGLEDVSAADLVGDLKDIARGLGLGAEMGQKDGALGYSGR